MATHRTNQLDIDLGRISDQGTRDAFQSVVTFVNEMTQKIRTNSEMKAQRFANANNSIRAEKDGKFLSKSLNIDSGGEFKVAIYSGDLGSTATVTITLPSGARVLGVFGMTQNNGTSTWIPLQHTSEGFANIVEISTLETDNIVLSGSGATNQYRMVVFYSDR